MKTMALVQTVDQQLLKGSITRDELKIDERSPFGIVSCPIEEGSQCGAGMAGAHERRAQKAVHVLPQAEHGDRQTFVAPRACKWEKSAQERAVFRAGRVCLINEKEGQCMGDAESLTVGPQHTR